MRLRSTNPEKFLSDPIWLSASHYFLKAMTKFNKASSFNPI